MLSRMGLNDHVLTHSSDGVVSTSAISVPGKTSQDQEANRCTTTQEFTGSRIMQEDHALTKGFRMVL